MELTDRRQNRELTRGDNTSDRGFTLLETSIALVVMMVVTLGTASLFVYAIKNNDGSNDQALALAVAQQRMERLRRTPFNDTSLNTLLSTETVTSAGRRYTVATTVCSTSDCGGSATLKIITVQVTPQNGSAWANNPAMRTVTTVGVGLGNAPPRGWQDGNGNFVVDCDLLNPLEQNNLATGGDRCAPGRSVCTALERPRHGRRHFAHPAQHRRRAQ